MAGMVIPPGASPTAPKAPKTYVPLGGDLQELFVEAMQMSPAGGGPVVGEHVEWSIVVRSAPTDFSIRCVFPSHMELGLSSTVPSGARRSENFITAAYPAKDPMEDRPVQLD